MLSMLDSQQGGSGAAQGLLRRQTDGACSHHRAVACIPLLLTVQFGHAAPAVVVGADGHHVEAVQDADVVVVEELGVVERVAHTDLANDEEPIVGAAA